MVASQSGSSSRSSRTTRVSPSPTSTSTRSCEGRGTRHGWSIAGRSSGGDDPTCDPEDCEHRHRANRPGAFSSFTSWARHEDLSPSPRSVLAAGPVRRRGEPWFHVHSGVVRRHGGRAVRRQVRRAAARVPGEVSARWGRGRDRDRGDVGRMAGTSPPARRTRNTFCRRAVMKRMAMIAASALLLGRGLAAQDTTQAAAPAAAAPQVTVVDAVVARSVLDRQPQDTGTVFPADVAQLISWTKVEGAGGSSIHHVWFHGDTQVGDVELQVGGSPWRTWSRKTVPADWTGAWHVEVRDAAGTVLKRIDFTVGQ